MTLVGARVGHIRLESELGRGGMGEVYRGFDEALERVVAVKTIRAEHRLSGSARARFLREARILSKLADPAICQVYDLIESQEADLLVLEFVEGKTLDRLRHEGALDEARTLRIGVKIAAALAIAHRERIIHRDLKPQNIMVTAGDAIKVLDFGIARSSTETVAAAGPLDLIETRELASADPERTIALARSQSGTDFSAALTQMGSIVGTVQYMSPEQALGQELTEASDLFSFGILLQELLTGRPAYASEPLPFLIQAVAENRSYPVTGVDPEIARLIEDLKHPIPARRPTAVEAGARLEQILDRPHRLRRRRLKIAAVSAAFAILTLVLAVVSWLALSEKRARARAESLSRDLEREAERASREATTANRVVEFLVDLFEQADPSNARGRDVTVKEIVAAGSRGIATRLSDEPLVQARLQATLGSITWKLGDLDQAAALLATARATTERERGDELSLANILALEGVVALDQGRFEAAAAALDRANSIYGKLPEAPAEDRARVENYLGALADSRGDLAEAERHYAVSLERLRALAKPPARDIARLLNNLAVLAWRKADYRAAEKNFRESLALNEGLLGADHPDLAAQLNNLGILTRDLGDYAESERLHLRALAIAEKSLGPSHPDVASILNSLARLYVRQNRLDEAAARLERALAICHATYGDEHAETATTLLRLGDVERRRGRLARAEARIPSARATLERVLGGEHRRLVEAWTAEGELRRAQGRDDAAREAFTTARRIGIATLGADHPEVKALEEALATLPAMGETAR